MLADVYAGKPSRTGTLSEPQLEESIAALEHTTSLWARQSVYHQTLSRLHLQRGRSGTARAVEFAAAERSLNAARNHTPGDYVIWLAYIELYTEWGLAGEKARFAQAEQAYRQAVTLFPGSAMLYTSWGLLYASQGRLEEAEAQFHQAVNLGHTDAWAFLYLGDT
jgi:Tfp pilus assembly protein PilF